MYEIKVNLKQTPSKPGDTVAGKLFSEMFLPARKQGEIWKVSKMDLKSFMDLVAFLKPLPGTTSGKHYLEYFFDRKRFSRLQGPL